MSQNGRFYPVWRFLMAETIKNQFADDCTGFRFIPDVRTLNCGAAVSKGYRKDTAVSILQRCLMTGRLNRRQSRPRWPFAAIHVNDVVRISCNVMLVLKFNLLSFFFFFFTLIRDRNRTDQADRKYRVIIFKRLFFLHIFQRRIHYDTDGIPFQSVSKVSTRNVNKSCLYILKTF